MKDAEWKGYIEDILNSKLQYVDTKKVVIVEGKRLFEKSVRTSEQIVTWRETNKGEIVHVERSYRDGI